MQRSALIFEFVEMTEVLVGLYHYIPLLFTSPGVRGPSLVLWCVVASSVLISSSVVVPSGVASSVVVSPVVRRVSLRRPMSSVGGSVRRPWFFIVSSVVLSFGVGSSGILYILSFGVATFVVVSSVVASSVVASSCCLSSWPLSFRLSYCPASSYCYLYCRGCAHGRAAQVEAWSKVTHPPPLRRTLLMLMIRAFASFRNPLKNWRNIASRCRAGCGRPELMLAGGSSTGRPRNAP